MSRCESLTGMKPEAARTIIIGDTPLDDGHLLFDVGRQRQHHRVEPAPQGGRQVVDAPVAIVGGGDRKAYQQDWRNAREALVEVRADIAERVPTW